MCILLQSFERTTFLLVAISSSLNKSATDKLNLVAVLYCLYFAFYLLWYNTLQ